jgi:glycosyltransferase involved in cell wall biosynthesis
MAILRRAMEVVRRARDVGTVVAQPRADGLPRSPKQVAMDLSDLAAAERSARTGNVAGAYPPVQRLLAGHPELWGPNVILATWAAQHGEPSTALAATQRLRARHDGPQLRRREGDLASRLLELDPTWLPTVAAEARPIEPRSPRAVLHLLKSSLPDRQSGYTIRSREILQAQVDAGLEPFVVTPYGYPSLATRRGVPSMEVVDGIRHYRLAPGSHVTGLTGPDHLSRTATMAVTVVRRERPALIHVASGHRGYEYALAALALKERLGLPVVYEVRGFLEETWTGDEGIAASAGAAELTRLRMVAEARVMDAADGIVTLGTAMRDELVERGVPASKIVVAPNGIDPRDFQPTPADPELRRRYGLEDRWVFGYISNMDHFREGHATLIRATAQLVAAGRNVACLLVGDGTLRRELEAEVAGAGLAGRVIFTGRVPHDEVQRHYALLDAFVVARVPDRASRFVTPLKPYEAMAMGIPLVVSDLPALTEIASPDERGLSFPVGDVEALASTLGRLIDNPELGPRLGAAGREWVIAERTWGMNGPRYVELYGSVLERVAATAKGASRSSARGNGADATGSTGPTGASALGGSTQAAGAATSAESSSA